MWVRLREVGFGVSSSEARGRVWQVLRFMVWGSGFEVWGWGFQAKERSRNVCDRDFEGERFKVQGSASGFRIRADHQDAKFRCRAYRAGAGRHGGRQARQRRAHRVACTEDCALSVWGFV